MTTDEAYEKWLDAEFQCRRWQARVALAESKFRWMSFGAALLTSSSIGVSFALDDWWRQAVLALAAAIAIAQAHIVTKDDVVALQGIYGEWVSLCSSWERVHATIKRGKSPGVEPLLLMERSDLTQKSAAKFATETTAQLEDYQTAVQKSFGIDID